MVTMPGLRHHLSTLIMVGSLVATSASLPPQLKGLLDAHDPSESYPKRVFVRYKSGHRDAAVRSIERQTRMSDPASTTKLLFDFQSLDTYVLDVESAGEMRALHDDPLVEEIHHDPPRTRQLLENSFRPYHPVTNLRSGTSQVIPYGAEMIQAPAAWRLGIKGSGVKICVLDSGTDLYHEDLNPSLMDGSQKSSPWYMDEEGHGTHVTGTIAAVDNRIGVVGIAPEAQIYSVKYLTDANGFTFASTLIHAAHECRDAGAKIINLSLGGPIWSPFEMMVFRDLLERDGILSFAAAGNNGSQRPSFPASYEQVTSVAAVDHNQRHADFSQYNSRVDLAAPGVDVLSLLPKGTCKLCQENGATNGYGISSGTSMATPHVSAAAALLWSFKPEATAGEILQAMTTSATDLGDDGHDSLYGHGLVNVMSALALLNGGALEEVAEPSFVTVAPSSKPPATSENGESQSGLGWFSSWFSKQAIETSEDCDDGFVEFTMSLKTDHYAAEIEWKLGHAQKASQPLLCYSGLENNTTYFWRTCLPSDCYTFVIRDTAKNGICCEHGDGSFAVSYGGEDILRGGEFLSEQSASMGVCSSSITSEFSIVELGTTPAGTVVAANDTLTLTPPILDGGIIPVETATPAVTDVDSSQAATVTEGAANTNDTSSNCVEITLELTTDYYPEEISFQLVDISSGSFELIWALSDFDPYTVHRYTTCQDPRGCYEFELNDSVGDGLCCEYGVGGFELSFGEDVVLSYTNQTQVQFGQGCSAVARRNGP